MFVFEPTIYPVSIYLSRPRFPSSPPTRRESFLARVLSETNFLSRVPKAPTRPNAALKSFSTTAFPFPLPSHLIATSSTCQQSSPLRPQPPPRSREARVEADVGAVGGDAAEAGVQVAAEAARGPHPGRPRPRPVGPPAHPRHAPTLRPRAQRRLHQRKGARGFS